MLRWPLLALALVTGCAAPAPEVVLPRRPVPAPKVVRADQPSARVLFVRTLPLVPSRCHPPGETDAASLERMRALPRSELRALQERLEQERVDAERCRSEEKVALPLACWDGTWRTGLPCVPLAPPGWQSAEDVVCTVKGAPSQASAVAVASSRAESAFVLPEGSAALSLLPPRVDGNGLEIDPAVEALVAAAVAREIEERPFLVTQSLARDLDADGREDLLLNVRVMFTSAAAGHSERHGLYLFLDHPTRTGAPPRLLLATSGKSATEHPELIAVTDLDGDGHVELVLAWEDYSVPVRTALVQVGEDGLRTIASWSCTERGIVGERGAPAGKLSKAPDRQ